jgi:hypothetical protein
MPAFPDRLQVSERLNLACQRLADNDAYLVREGVHERSVTHKLAEYLQLLFDEWHVDCEYNKDGPDLKGVLVPNAHLDLEDSPVLPDIIVHRRGDWRTWEAPPHLLAIEARSDRHGQAKIERDTFKVCGYVESLRYRFGILIEFWWNGQAVDYEFEILEGPNAAPEPRP